MCTIQIITEESERSTSRREHEYVSRSSTRVEPIYTIREHIRYKIWDIFTLCDTDEVILGCADTDHCLHSLSESRCQMGKYISLIWTSDDEEEIFFLSIWSECSLQALWTCRLRILDEYDSILFSYLLEPVRKSWDIPEILPHTLRTYLHLIRNNSNREDIHSIMHSWELSFCEFVFFSPRDDDILTISPIPLICLIETYTIWKYYLESVFTSEFWNLRIDNCNSSCTLHNMHLGIEVFLHILVPILMIYLEVGKYTIVRLELAEYMAHKTRHLKYDISPFFSLLEDIKNSCWEWNIKIPWEIYWFFDRILFFEYIIHNPTRCGLTICTGYRDNLESPRHVPIGEVELRDYLACLIDSMCSRNSWRWDNHLIGIIRTRCIRIIIECVLEPEMCHEFRNCRTNFSFTVY